MRLEEQTTVDQTALWNGHAGQAWVDAQEMLDRLLKPVADRLAEAVEAAGARQVLDVGCGTGGTTIAAARAIPSEGGCVGVDISAPMIALARTRAERARVPARFIQDDAQTHAFEPERFDIIISRFGVMFFDDPAAAFANLRRAARAGARLRVLAWRSMAENPFMTTAERAAAPLLPNLSPRRPDAPGQFAFADPERVRGILGKSGWDAIDIQPFDFACALPEAALVPYFTRMGPLGQLFGEADAQMRTRIIETVRPAFDPFTNGSEVRFTAACWEVSARLR